MNQPIKYYSALELARDAGCQYPRVLSAIHNGELTALKVGGSYAIESSTAEAWAEQQRLLADPNAVAKLQAEIAELKAENRALRTGSAA